MPKKITVDYKRARKRSTCTAEWKSWESRDGLFKVEEAVSTLENRSRFYAMRLSAQSEWRMITHMETYRTRKAAEKVIEKYIRSGSPLSKTEVILERESRRLSDGSLLRRPLRKNVS